MIKLNDILNEKNIGVVSTDIKLKVSLEKSVHAGERQYRHTDIISEDDIINTVETALKKIGLSLIFDKVDIDEYVHIFNPRNNLNVIGFLKDKGNNTIEFIVVTVMTKRNFKPKPGTLTIRA